MLAAPAFLAAVGFALFTTFSGMSGPAASWFVLPQTAGGMLMWMSLAWLAGRFCALLLHRMVAASAGRLTYPRLLSDLLRAALFAGAMLTIPVSVFGYPAAGLVTVSSVAVAAVGFGLRNVIGDLFAGIAVGIEQPYRTGDWIETSSGAAGRVQEVGWRTTRLLDRNGFAIILPNGATAGQRLNNYSDGQRDYRVALRVPLDATIQVARARRILLSAALGAGRTIPNLSPDVLVADFADGAANYLVRFRVPDFGREAACRDAVAGCILQALQCAGETIRSPGLLASTQVIARPAAETLLAHADLFRSFEAEARAELAQCMRRLEIPEGQVVFRQGDIGESLCILAEGLLDVEIIRPDADPVLSRIAPGEVFGEIALLTGHPRSATITAALDAVIYEIEASRLEPVMKNRPALAEGLAAVMAQRLAYNDGFGRDAEPAQAEREDLLGRLRVLFGLPVTSK